MIPLDLPSFLASHAHPLRVQKTVRVHSVSREDAASTLKDMSLGALFAAFLYGVVGKTIGVNQVADKSWRKTYLVGGQNIAILALLTDDFLAVLETVRDKESRKNASCFVFLENFIAIVAFKAEEGVCVFEDFAVRIFGQASVVDETIPPLAG